MRKWLAANVSPEAAAATRIIYGGSGEAAVPFLFAGCVLWPQPASSTAAPVSERRLHLDDNADWPGREQLVLPCPNRWRFNFGSSCLGVEVHALRRKLPVRPAGRPYQPAQLTAPSPYYLTAVQ